MLYPPPHTPQYPVTLAQGPHDVGLWAVFEEVAGKHYILRAVGNGGKVGGGGQHDLDIRRRMPCGVGIDVNGRLPGGADVVDEFAMACRQLQHARVFRDVLLEEIRTEDGPHGVAEFAFAGEAVGVNAGGIQLGGVAGHGGRVGQPSAFHLGRLYSWISVRMSRTVLVRCQAG